MDERQLKELMNSDPVPSADENARKRALNLALAAYDEAQQDKEKTRQGFGWFARLTGRSNNRPGRRFMTNIKKYSLIGGTATAAAALLGVFTYATFERLPLEQAKPIDTVASVDDGKSLGAGKSSTSGKPADAEKKDRPESESRVDLALRGVERDANERAGAKTEELVRQPAPSSIPESAKPKSAESKFARPAEISRQTTESVPPKVTGKAKPAPAPMSRDALSGTAGAAGERQALGMKQAPAPSLGDKRLQGALNQPAPPQGRTAGGMVRKEAYKQKLQSKSFRAPPSGDVVSPYYKDVGRDKFAAVEENPIKRVADAPVSTFSSDVDTASYSFVRRRLNRGVLPQKHAVRVEELINYFDYAYPLPETREQPFHPSVTVMPSPWKKGNKLVHIGIKGYDIDAGEKPRSNLVFLLDVSGSMNAPDKLPLMVNSLKLLLDTLKADDTVAIVVYAGAAGTVLEPTKIAEKHKILAALDRLRAGGSTAGAAGIRQAYALAQGTFDKKAVNRVILATDGDFNVGITNREQLKGFVERKRKTGVFLSVFGFGQGNLNDQLMQTLAQNGNGVAAHIDTLNEARKVLVEEASSTLFPIAKDVKIQVEFNPATVAEYRLIGYETRALKREDFRNDKVDAGDIGAGHTVTAIYEITPVKGGETMIGSSRYRTAEPAVKTKAEDRGSEYAFLKIRYKLPDQDTSTLITTPIAMSNEFQDKAEGTTAIHAREARWATAVAAFGQILKGGKYTSGYSYDDVIALAKSAKGDDEFGYRAEFLNLVRLARSASALPGK
jgi:Ca-activated chloride channel family protein